MTVFGYARVSTDGQTLASQDAELMAAGCAKVYQEKVSGARTDRAELAKVLKRIEAGDLLIVTRLDRLARSNSRSTQHPPPAGRKGRQVQIPPRPVGRYDNAAGRAAGDDPGWLRAIRATPNQSPHRRRQEAGQGSRREVRAPPQAPRAPAPRGTAAACQRRNAGGRGPNLRR